MLQRLEGHWQRFYDRLPDPDAVFAYDTIKNLRVLDRRLGFIYWSVKLVVLLYVVVYVFLIKKSYTDSEKTNGWVIMKAQNAMHSKLGYPWDQYESITNPGESGAIFIPTRIVMTQNQTEEHGLFCPSPLHKCKTHLDCDIGNSWLQTKNCTKDGYCMRRGWCPAEDTEKPTTEVHLIDFSDVTLWFQSYVHFHTFQIDIMTTDERESRVWPAKLANTYAVYDLLRMANIPPAEAIENGVVMIVNALFECDFDAEKCVFEVKSGNIDTRTGFNHVHYHYWRDENGKRRRDQLRMYGIRIVAAATGIGKVASLGMIILQVSSAIALLGVAENVADVYLQYIVAERKHYEAQKIIETEDFND
eukprot:gnl/TRDRNA2_/TRDRNA2_188640_c0_seq1.p1 gnl/TRDRNA2_/TRDRNA2_188640_c0~~gnl/TRDRNA2_/TRDRNA2_188640_c0_seq1.p1  ORF type:complete len:360 (+),score=64.56 gnl/TRDRNA2_/TRDRNA2_188640_c0_seq1:95-1174(+)